MKQFETPADKKITIDYNDATLPEPVRMFRPAVFKDGNNFCCLLGDPEEGVFGCGNSFDESIEDWSRQLRVRIKNPTADDEVLAYINRVMSENGRTLQD